MSESFQPDPAEEENPHSYNTLSDESDNEIAALDQHQGTTVCFNCGKRDTEAEIQACELESAGRSCPKVGDRR